MIGGLLLAAGRSRRFGSDKLLVRLPDGAPICTAATSAMVVALPEVVAVVRPGAPALAAALRDRGARVIVCPHAEDGMGASLAYGVAATPDWTGWLVALADMPFVQPATVLAVAAAVANGAALAAPRYQGRRGHPVCFGASYREALAALTGDCGGRDLVQAASHGLCLVDCDDPGVLADIDTPADLARIATGTRLPRRVSN